MPRIIQIVRYVSITGAPGPGTVALDDTGKLYLLGEAADYSLVWKEMPVPMLPDPIQTAIGQWQGRQPKQKR